MSSVSGRSGREGIALVPASRISAAIIPSIAGLVAVLALPSATCHAGGLLLQQTNVSGLGNAHAGGAAAADDGSTLFHNAAGLARVNRRQLVVGGVGLRLAAGITDTMPPGTPGATPAYGSQRMPDTIAALPHVYYTHPVNDKVTVAAGLSGPYGIAINYPSGWAGRNQSLQTDIKVARASVGVALKLSGSLSVGGALTGDYFLTKIRLKVPYQQAMATRYRDVPGALKTIEEMIPVIRSACELARFSFCIDEAREGPYTPDRVVDAVSTLLGPTADGRFPGYEAEATISTTGFRPNFEVGALWQPSDDLRVGLRYRPATVFNNKGTVRTRQPAADSSGDPLKAVLFYASEKLATMPGAPLMDADLSYEITLPRELQLSAVAKLTDRLEVMGDVIRQGWSRNTYPSFVRSDGYVIKGYPMQLVDTTRYALGASYQVTPKFKLRAGYSWEKSVVSDAERVAVLPDNDRKIYALGLQYRHDPDTVLDFGVNRIAFRESALGSSATGPYALDGIYSSRLKLRLDMLGMQFTRNY